MIPSRDETWLRVADVIALRSRCVRAQCGAVIVDMENRIVATGYNGPPANFPHEGTLCNTFCERAQVGPGLETMRTYDDCVALHAEANALMYYDRRLAPGGTIYVTGAVCFNCAKLIANSGLRRVVMRVRDTEEHRDPIKSVEFLWLCDVNITVI